MKKIFKGIFIPLVLSMVFGYIFARVVYSIYGEDVENRLSSSKIFLVKRGEYTTYDSMREDNSGSNYIYYVDEDIYKTVVGITKDESNVEKIKSLYDDNLSVEEYYVSKDLLNEKQMEYDMLLNNANNIYEVKEVVDNILSLYKDEDMIRLVFMN